MTETIHEKKNAFFYIKRILGLLLLLSLAAVFFYSGVSKIYSLEAFEWTFMDLGVGSLTTAAILARLFIGLELIVGAFLLFHIYLKQVTYPITIGLLALLTGYLVVLLIKQGDTGNCGCFGDWLYMKPQAAIWKNLGMIAATVLLYILYPINPYKNQEWLSAVLGMAAMVVPFVISTLNTNHQPSSVNHPINMTPLYETKLPPTTDLRKGKHIVAFMSLTCPHCRKAAYSLKVIHNQHPEIPIYMVLTGHKSQLKEFFDETHSATVPYTFFADNNAFVEMAGDSVPAIYWISNSVIELESNVFQLDPSNMKQWLKQ